MRALQLLSLMALLATAAKADPFLGPYNDLNSDLFAAFFAGLLDPSTFALPFRPIPTGASADGYVIGVVDDAAFIHTAFLYRNGQLSCCFLDFPFRFTGINNQDVIIGWNPDFGPFVASAGSGGDEDVNEEHLTFTDPSFDPYAVDPFASFFYAIDDQNRILADVNGQQYMLLPTPEPASVLLLVAGLIFMGLVFRSRVRKRTARVFKTSA